MKPLEVLILSEDPRNVQKLRNRLNQRTGVLDNFDINFSTSQYREQEPYELIRENDILIVDYSVLATRGLEVLERIKAWEKRFPRILYAGNRINSPVFRDIFEGVNRGYIHGVLGGPFNLRLVIDAFNEGLTNGILDDSMDTSEIQKVVKQNLKRDLNIGIIGLGLVGRQLAVRFNYASDYSKNGDYVGDLKGYSDSKEAREIFKAVCKGSSPYSEYYPDYYRVTASDSLEEVLEGTDFVLICTSAIHGPPAAKIAKGQNRLDLFEIEGPKVYNLCKRIARLDYPGAVFIITNPIGTNKALAVRAGLTKDQVSFPFSIDKRRVYGGITDELYKIFGKYNYERVFRDFEIEKYPVVGEHGIPFLAGFKDQEFPKECGGLTREEIRELVKRAETKSREAGEDALRAMTILKHYHYVSLDEATYFFETLSHFDETPDTSAYCYTQIRSQAGYIALPVRVQYFPNIRIEPNHEQIQRFDEETLKKLEAQLAIQNQYLKDYHKPRAYVRRLMRRTARRITTPIKRAISKKKAA